MVADILARVGAAGTVRALKVYRMAPDAPLPVPSLPCLDHEAQLHDTVDPHIAVYLQDAGGDLHEIAFTPAARRIDVDTTSTLGEQAADAHARLLQRLGELFPEYRVGIHGPSWWRGERRVAAACRAQVTLRDVLVGTDLARVERRLARLQLISSLMEKESRVASWGVRTVTGPVLAAVAFVTYQVLGYFAASVGEPAVAGLRYGLIGALGAVFLYYGLKAVQLTAMANRVWKRSAEYSLIVEARRRLAAAAPATR